LLDPAVERDYLQILRGFVLLKPKKWPLSQLYAHIEGLSPTISCCDPICPLHRFCSCNLRWISAEGCFLALYLSYDNCTFNSTIFGWNKPQLPCCPRRKSWSCWN
jgi:hypothetical protein